MPGSKNRSKAPPPLKLVSFSNTNMKSQDIETKSDDSGEEKSRLNKFFNLKSLMSPGSPKSKEFNGFRFPTAKHNRAMLADSKFVPDEEKEHLPMPLQVSTDSPEKRRQGSKDRSHVPHDTPAKAIKTLGLSDGSRKMSKAERVLGAAHIHDASLKELYHLHGQTRNKLTKPKPQHPYDEPSPTTDEEQTSNVSAAVAKARNQAYEDLCTTDTTPKQDRSLSPSRMLVRGKSLRYMDNEGPPTPPEKDTLKVARQVGGTEMRNSSSLGNEPGFVQMFDRPGSRSNTRETNILALGANASQHQDVSLVHQDSIASMRGSVEGATSSSGSRYEMNSPEEPSIPKRVSSLQDAEDVRNSGSTSQKEKNQSDSMQLQPTFYTPSLYSCSSQYTRPSRNVSLTSQLKPQRI
jgi:hypothetical protein